MLTAQIRLLLFCGVLISIPLLSLAAETSATEGAFAQARQWTAAKFLGQVEAQTAGPHLMVYLRSGAILRNRIGGRAFDIAGQRFDQGIAMPSPGEVLVRLPRPGATFEAVVGVDSNDLGYYANTGRGSVVTSVEVGGREAFRSPVMREGLAGIPVKVSLNGAREFSLNLAHSGDRSPTYQASWDQADWARARVTLQDGSTLKLADLPTGPLPGSFSIEPPFSFRYGDRPFSELLKSWKLRRASRSIDVQRTEHTLTYTDPNTALEVRAVAVAYSDFPVVEWTVYLKNNGDAPGPILEDIQALDTRLERDMSAEFLLHHSKGSPNSPTDYQPLETVLGSKADQRIATNGGRPTDSDLCYFNLEWAGQGVIIGLGWPGQWAARFQRDEGAGLRVRGGQEFTHFRLMPGEEVRTPLIALLFWQGDWIGGQNVWRRWMVAHNLPRPGGRLPPPQLAGGSARKTVEMQEATEENQKQFLNRDLDAGLPLDYWWMDAGWYSYKDGWWKTGTWEPDPVRFPRGLGPVAAAAHARNVKTIVWFEPERVAPGSWLYEKHPEWLIGPEGKNRLLYLGNPEAWQWTVEHVSQLIRDMGVDLYRQDFNFEPLLLWRANDAEDRQGISEIKHVTGYLAYFDELRRRFPNMLLDTCASGGRRNDLETLRRSVPLWRSDYAYEPTAMQQLTYGIALWIPFFGTAVNSVDPYIFRSQMAPSTAIGLSPAKDVEYKQFRGLVDQWRRVAQYFYGDYYPLTPYRTETSEWMAWQFNRPDQGDGMVQAFRRPDSSFVTARFKLRGLDAGARYKVTDVDLGNPAEFSGQELMETGLQVSIGKRPGAVILTYQRAKR